MSKKYCIVCSKIYILIQKSCVYYFFIIFYVNDQLGQIRIEEMTEKDTGERENRMQMEKVKIL